MNMEELATLTEKLRCGAATPEDMEEAAALLERELDNESTEAMA